MKQILKSCSKPERVTMPGGLKKRVFACGCVSLIVLLCTLQTSSAVVAKSGGYSAGGGGVSSSQIRRLITEKQQKYAQLEQCTKKVNGFKIAGISTLGLTAVGVGGNIALASKNKDLERDINNTRIKIEEEQKKKADIEAKIKEARAEKRKANQTSKSECANITGATWKNDKCVCDDATKTIKNGICTDADIPGLLSGGCGDDYSFKADCLAHPEIATWKVLEPYDDGTERGDCLCNDSSKVFENSKCISKAVAQRRCLDTGGWWEDDFCVCGDYEEGYKIPTAELSGDIDETSLECKLNSAFIDKYKPKQDSSGRWWPAEYIDGKCIKVDGDEYTKDRVICTAVDESVWSDKDADGYTMNVYMEGVFDEEFNYLPKNAYKSIGQSFSDENMICAINGRVVQNCCSYVGGKYIYDNKNEYDQYELCSCPDNKVFFDAKCMSEMEAEKKCKESGGKPNSRELSPNGTDVTVFECECDYSFSDDDSGSCVTEAEYEKWKDLLL